MTRSLSGFNPSYAQRIKALKS